MLYKDYAQKRNFRQLLNSLIFIVILLLGWHFPLFGYFIPLCMFFGMGIGLFRGRKWCDWYCPRGSFYDALASKVSQQRRIPVFLRKVYFRLGILFLLLLIMIYNVTKRWFYMNRLGIFFIAMISVTTTIGVIFAVIFHHRTWCFICPVGTIIALIDKRRYVVEIDSNLCVECKVCANVCPMQIRPYSFKGKDRQVIAERDCLRCGLCIAACPKKALRFRLYK